MAAPHLGQFSELLSRIPPGTVTAVVRTPIGVYVTDPFSGEASQVAEWLRPFFQLEVYPGAPHPEDLQAPSLTENLKVLGLMAGGIAVWMLVKRRRG